MKKTVLVIGGTGAQGVAVVKALTSDSKYNARILTRNRSTREATKLARIPGSEVFEGSPYNEVALREALQGVNSIFVNTNGLAIGEKAEIYWGIRIYELSREFRLEHFVYAGLPYASKLGNFHPRYRCSFMDGKGKVVDYLSTQPTVPMAWSVLTSCPYMEALSERFRPFPDPSDPSSLIFVSPLGDTKCPLIHLDDYGAYARWIFDTPDRSNGLQLHVATEDGGWTDLAAAFTELTGQKSRYKAVTLDEYFQLGILPNPDEKLGPSSDSDDPTLLTRWESYSGFWNAWKDSLTRRDYDLLDDILPRMTNPSENGWKRQGILESLRQS
ncbi:hypothetical protein ACHAO4_010361 [Trichoderma viride]